MIVSAQVRKCHSQIQHTTYLLLAGGNAASKYTLHPFLRARFSSRSTGSPGLVVKTRLLAYLQVDVANVVVRRARVAPLHAITSGGERMDVYRPRTFVA